MERKIRKEKDSIAFLEFDGQLKDTRLQLQEQLKCLDLRLESHVAMLVEIQDFYKRRAEVEMEYSKNMDKLVRQIVSRHKADKRETWPGYSTYSIWQTLLSTTKKLGKDHGVLSELYSNQMVFRINELAEDTQRIFRKCREMATLHHSELVKSLTELQSSMKTYHLYYGESLHAEGKLRQIESQKVKIESSISGKVLLSRRLRNIEKQSEKRQLKYVESRLKAVKARNEYLLSLEAANASLQKYYSDDLHDLISAVDYGYHSTLGRAVMLHISAEDNMLQSRNGCLDLLNKRVRDLNQKCDKQTFLDLFVQPFQPPKPFEFQAHKGDEIYQLSGQKTVQDDLIDRLRSIAERLNALKVENDEIWKTLETTDSRLLEMVTQKDYDVTRFFQDDSPQPPRSPLEREKHRSDQLETEEFYLDKFHHYQTTNNLIARLQAKYNCIEKALTENNCLVLSNMGIPAVPPKPKRRKPLGKAPPAGRPQLFGGTITDYVEASGDDIPLIVKSCIRIINLYGMHHQGVFRVSGSQIEINEFKSQFERGLDLSPDQVDGKDINSVAGVLKLYFRELKEPLFPFSIFQDLINFISNNSFTNPEELPESITCLRHLLATSLPRPVIVLMRFLFAFLNHLSEFSDENMMDPYNLAICFGPTLMPVPEEHDQVVFQSHVNELIKNIIIFQDEIFPHDGGTMYERCEVQVDGRPAIASDNLSDDEEILEELASEDDLDVTEAVALFDFQGRTDRELSFKKGDTLVVYEKVSADWWEGAVGNREGLLPDKYISVQTKNKYGTFKSKEEDKFKSTESLPLKSFTLSVVGFDDLSPMSASHPNLELRNSSNLQQAHSSSNSSNSSQIFNSEDMSTLKILTAYKPEEDAAIVLNVTEEMFKKPLVINGSSLKSGDGKSLPLMQKEIKQFTSQDVEAEKTAEDLSSDIDFALAEVMSGIHSLGLQHGLDVVADDFKHTPDLVIGLPQTSSQIPSPKSTLVDDANVLTNAEVFANADQCTIKKGQGISVHNKDKQEFSAFLKRYNFTEKKYATLGRMEGKEYREAAMMLRQNNQQPSGDRNTFGKPKQGPASMTRQHSIPASSHPPIAPPVRTTSRIATTKTSDSSRSFEPPGALRPGAANTLDLRFLGSIFSQFDENIIKMIPERRISNPDSSVCFSGQKPAVQPTANLNPSGSGQSRRSVDPPPATKPAIKVKPPIMKKPTRASESTKKLQDSQTTCNSEAVEITKNS